MAVLLAGSGGSSARAEPPRIATHLLRLSTGGETETGGALFLPVGRPPRAGVVVVVHGDGGDFYSGVPGHLSSALAERGFAALTVNLRDHDAGPQDDAVRRRPLGCRGRGGRADPAGAGQRAQRSRASGGRTSVPVKLTISTSSTEEFSARPWHPIAARVGFPRSP